MGCACARGGVLSERSLCDPDMRRARAEPVLCRAVLSKDRREADAPRVEAQSGYEAATAFLFCVRCACKESKRFKHSLVFTAFPFALPATLLLLQGTYFLGACAVALTCTSILYHGFHWPAVRAADVLLAWLVGAAGCVQAIIAIVQNPTYPVVVPMVLSFGGVAGIFMINMMPSWFYEQNEPYIALPWHMCVHLLTTASLTGLAIGYGAM